MKFYYKNYKYNFIKFFILVKNNLKEIYNL